MTVATLLLLAIMYLSHTCLLWSSTHYCAPLHVSGLCPHHATLAIEIAALLSTLTVLHVTPKYWPSLASQHVETTEFIHTAALHAFFVCAQAVLWSICSCHRARSHFRSPPYEIPSHLSLASKFASRVERGFCAAITTALSLSCHQVQEKRHRLWDAICYIAVCPSCHAQNTLVEVLVRL
jgi:hypothetical protein